VLGSFGLSGFERKNGLKRERREAEIETLSVHGIEIQLMANDPALPGPCPYRGEIGCHGL
jgi:hypothetical protein